MQIKVNVKGVEVEKYFPDSLEGLAEETDNDSIYRRAKRDFARTLKNVLRYSLKNYPGDVERAKQAVEETTFTIKQAPERLTAKERVLNAYRNASQEERKEMLQQLKQEARMGNQS